VCLEAQASAVPVVTTTATGAIESVVDGITGVLVPVGDSQALARAIAQLLADPALRQKMGNAARERTEREFVQDAIWETTIRNYQALLAAAGRPTAIRGPRRARAAKAGI
jgi:glycosyltransferase involved in cell wall biosynthesis